MPLPLIGLLAGFKAVKPAGLALAGALTFGAGFVAAEVYENRVPWGLAAQRNDALKELGAWRFAAQEWEKAQKAWEESYGELDADRDARNNDATNEVTNCSTASSANVSAAFDSGYRAGRAAGRRTCGAPDATSPNPPAVPGPGGVRDAGPTLSGRWAGRAYRPEGAVPADGGRAVPR